MARWRLLPHIMKLLRSIWFKLILMIAGVAAIITLINVSVQRSRRSMVEVELETVADYQISGKFQSVGFLAVVWDSLILADNGEVKDFLNRSEEILKDYGSDEVESLMAAPDGIIQYVYPYSFSDQIGLDIEHDSCFADVAVRSRYTGLDTVSSPELLEDGDYRLYFCHPIYVRDRVGKPSFWGYSIVTVRTSDLVTEFHLGRMSSHSCIRLSRMDSKNGKQILYDDTEGNLKKPVQYCFSVPNGTLMLEGMWDGGWITANELAAEILIALAGVFVALMVLMNLRIRKNMRTLSQISYSDELTGINNRHMLRKVFEDLEGEQKHVSMLFIDFDHFKDINDNEGHEAGDEALKQGAAFFVSVFGKESCFRYGGDEFLMLMVDIPDEEARAKAARLKEFRTITFQGHEIHVSVSGGFATADCSSVEDLRTLIRMADDNLYHAKESGRDQIFGGEA